MPKIIEMISVREYSEGYPVELWKDDESGRLVFRARNEGGNNEVLIDVMDLIEWMRAGNDGTAVAIPSNEDSG